MECIWEWSDMNEAEKVWHMIKWMRSRKRLQGNAQMTAADIEAWGVEVRSLPGWEPRGKEVKDGVSLQEMWGWM